MLDFYNCDVIILTMSESVKAYVFMGLKHCGKSTQGKIIAEKMGFPFADTDVLVEQNMGMSARDIYAKKGVVAFTLAEQAACESIAEQYAEKSVIVASGGGICDNPPALYALKSIGPFVFINLDINYCISRVECKITQDQFGNFQNAPGYVLAKNPKTPQDVHDILFQKFKDRIDQYRHIADIVIDIHNASVEQNTDEITRVLF